MADQNTKTTKQERPNKDEIKGLPAHPKNKENLTRSVKQSSKC